MEPTATDPTPATGHYHRITLATDGSKDARAAAAALGALPWEAGTSITVVGVVSVNRPSAGSALPMTGVGQDAAAFIVMEQDAARASVTEAVATTTAALRAAAPGITIAEVVRTGTAAAEILAQAGEDGADLVVAGAKGHGMLGAFVLGSVSEALVDRSACPVLIVRGEGWAAAPTVLVGIGPEDSPERLGDALLKLPLPQGTQIVAVEVTDGKDGDQSERLATHLAANSAGLTVDSRSLSGDVADELVETATAISADLIVTGARARRGMHARLGLGSVSRAIVRRAECSVLVVRPGT